MNSTIKDTPASPHFHIRHMQARAGKKSRVQSRGAVRRLVTALIGILQRMQELCCNIKLAASCPRRGCEPQPSGPLASGPLSLLAAEPLQTSAPLRSAV